MSQEITCVSVDVENRKHLCTLVGMSIDSVTSKNSVKVPQKLKIVLPYDPAILFLGMYLKEMELLSQRGI